MFERMFEKFVGNIFQCIVSKHIYWLVDLILPFFPRGNSWRLNLTYLSLHILNVFFSMPFSLGTMCQFISLQIVISMASDRDLGMPCRIFDIFISSDKSSMPYITSCSSNHPETLKSSLWYGIRTFHSKGRCLLMYFIGHIYETLVIQSTE